MAKAKGTTLVGAVKYLRTRRDEAKSLLAPELHHYLEERISPSAWYAEPDLLALIRAMLALLPGDAEEVLSMMGRVTAQSHGEGIYAHLLDGGASPTSSFALWSSMHDTGRLIVETDAPRRIRVHLIDYAQPSPEMCTIVGGYIEESLRAGGRVITGEKLACCLADGDRCTWRFEWTAGSPF